MKKLVLKKNSRRARVRTGHPWVFAGEVEALPESSMDGKALPLEDEKGRFLGMGIVNTRSQIIWRRYSRHEVGWGEPFFEKAIEEAVSNREEEPFRRLVWSEADDVPGLVVDQFEDVLVVQALTLAVDHALAEVCSLLQKTFSPREIILRNDAPTRRKEGLELANTTVSGRPLDPFWARIYEVWYQLDLQGAQKTGFYLDQRQEHFKVATLAPDWRVLDAFCNQGAFGINCALAGAREVIGIDTSVEAVHQARANAERNEVTADFRAGNVFDFFTETRGEERFDLIILDPPSFAPNKRVLGKALKGYKELHIRAFNCLNTGGILATYCCSHHVTRTVFHEVIESAAADTGRKVQVLYEPGQPTDHPVILNFPESSYLKGFVLRILA